MGRGKLIEDIRANHDTIKTLLDQLQEGIVVADRNGEIIFWNKAAQKIIGVDDHSGPQTDWNKTYGLFKKDRKTHFPIEELPLSKAIKGVEENKVEIHIRNESRPDWFVIGADAVALQDENGEVPGGMCVFRDITLEKTLEGQVIEQRSWALEASRMASISNLCAGLSHEINNPLEVINGLATVISNRLKDGELDLQDALKKLDVIRSSSIRIGNIINGLRELVDKDCVIAQESCLNAVIQKCELLLTKRFSNHNIEFRKEAPPGELMVSCNPTQVTHAILELLTNAFDAVKNLSTCRWIRLEVLESSDAVGIAVTDSGHGIDKRVQGSLFEPFSSKKPPGRGAGLGLFSAKMIATQQGGNLQLDQTSPNTRFILKLSKAKSNTP